MGIHITIRSIIYFHLLFLYFNHSRRVKPIHQMFSVRFD